MLSIRDLLDQFEIDGKVVVKSFDDDGNETILYNDLDIQYADGDFMDKNIKYMYPEKNGFEYYIVIEVGEIDV